MRILMLSWEYPPRIVGGIARHVEEISRELVAQGHEVHVVTADHPNTLEHEQVHGVWVHRVKSPHFEPPDFLHWVLQLNNGLTAYALQAHVLAPFDLIHAHDWLVGHSAVTLKKGLGLPLVATIHATEFGRNKGQLHSPLSKYIHQMEWWLMYEAWRVIVCANNMHREVTGAFGVPADKLDVIPNGIRYKKFDDPMPAAEAQSFRRYLAHDHQKLVLFVGRMVPEKGAQLLLEAVPKVLAAYHDARFVVVGKGGFLPELKYRAQELGVTQFVNFTGFVSDEDLLKLYQVVDVAVFPSLYEPFGIVALEGMAACKATVVSDAGGLGEIVQHGQSGITTFAGDANSLAWGLLEVLKKPEQAAKLAAAGRKRVEEVFNWTLIAQATENIYSGVLAAAGKQDGAAQAAAPVDEKKESAKGKAKASKA